MFILHPPNQSITHLLFSNYSISVLFIHFKIVVFFTRDCGVSDNPRMWHWLNSLFFYFGTYSPHIPVPSAPHVCGTNDKIRHYSLYVELTLPTFVAPLV